MQVLTQLGVDTPGAPGGRRAKRRKVQAGSGSGALFPAGGGASSAGGAAGASRATRTSPRN